MTTKKLLLRSAALTGALLGIVYGTIGVCVWLIQHGYGA